MPLSIFNSLCYIFSLSCNGLQEGFLTGFNKNNCFLNFFYFSMPGLYALHTKLVCACEIICINACNLLHIIQARFKMFKEIVFWVYINMYRYALISYPFHIYFNFCHWLNGLYWDKNICQIYHKFHICARFIFLFDQIKHNQSISQTPLLIRSEDQQ